MFGDRRYERLSRLSVSHLYNLRRSKTYRARRTAVNHTRPARVGIGERRRPDPGGKPGFVRVDTVHQGDRDREKGVDLAVLGELDHCGPARTFREMFRSILVSVFSATAPLPAGLPPPGNPSGYAWSHLSLLLNVVPSSVTPSTSRIHWSSPPLFVLFPSHEPAR